MLHIVRYLGGDELKTLELARLLLLDKLIELGVSLGKRGVAEGDIGLRRCK